MHIQLAIIAVLGLVGSSYACYSCYSPCYWCGGGGGGGYFPTYRPSFPYWGGGGGGGSASASAAASASGGGGGYPYGGGGGASAAAAAASAAGGGASAASAAASAAGGGGGGGYPYYQQPYWGNQYWDVGTDAAAQIKDKKSACAVLIEQYVDQPVLANDLIRVVNETFFNDNARKIQAARNKNHKNFTLDATPSTFHCCHVLYGNELLKKDGLINDDLVENATGVHLAKQVNASLRRARSPVNVRKQQDLKHKVPPQIYALPILPPKTTCASLTDMLFDGLKAQLGGKTNDAHSTTTARSSHQQKKKN